jgi:hypothetical protein
MDKEGDEAQPPPNALEDEGCEDYIGILEPIDRLPAQWHHKPLIE